MKKEIQNSKKSSSKKTKKAFSKNLKCQGSKRKNISSGSPQPNFISIKINQIGSNHKKLNICRA